MTKLMTKIGRSALMLMIALLASGAAQMLSAQQQVEFTGEQYREHMLWLGEEFTFDFDAVAYPDNNVSISYALELTPMSPVGMTIDETTGVVTWTPQSEGYFEMTVKAYVTDNPDIYNYAFGYLIVRDRANFNLCAHIQGQVTLDETNEPVQAYIAALPVDFMDDNWGSPIYPDLFVQTDENGYYDLEVPEGQFYLAVMGETINFEFFENTQLIEDATAIDIDCDQTVTANFSVAEGYLLFFCNYPESVLITGEDFEFYPEMYNPREFELSFELINAPEGMTIDQSTGYIYWTAGAPGSYEFTIKATAVNRTDVFVEQVVSLFVIEEAPERCAYITGTIVDQNGDPVANAFVGAISTLIVENKMFPESESLYGETQTDENGNYSLYLAESDYIVMAGGMNIISEFYEDAEDFTQATLVTIECGNTAVVNMTVELLPPPEVYTITGRVVSEETGEPVQAVVAFMLADREDEFNEFGMCIGAASTDQDGYYTMETTFNGFNVIAVAYPQEFTYMVEYYDNATDWASAAVLVMDRDYDNINFTLASYPEFDNSMHGIVRDENGNGIQANVVAWLINPDGFYPYDYICPTVATDPDNIGEFEFTQLIPGDYLLFALPYSDEAIPGFYVEGEIATLDYEAATLITIGAEDHLMTNHEIILPVRGMVPGIVKLEGVVTGNDVTTKMVNGERVTNNSIQGVVVAAIDVAGNIIDYATTDAEGKYSLEGVDAGVCNVTASKQGYETYKTNIPITEQQKQINKDIHMLKRATTGVDNGSANNNGVTLAPNPASQNIKIDFNASAQDAKLTVANEAGRIVILQQIKALDGSNSVTLDVSNLPAGRYFTLITGKKLNIQSSFSVIR